ncbi:hypothetical protein QBC42DRAFT_198487, partial [Cladorrhinum samala]
MGIFSFLHRKSEKNKAAAALKANAYDFASTGSLPIQGGRYPYGSACHVDSHSTGAYPVAGNGPNVVDTLSRGRPVMSQTQLPLDVGPSSDEQAAPAPGVPLYREQSAERPSTAPNGRPPSFIFSGSVTRLKKNQVKRAPPVSFRMFTNSTNDAMAPASRPASQGSVFTLADAPQRAPAHSRSNSMRSDGGRGFKDVLDAHSEIAPLDFWARVKATGARDYGEDVADRNLGQNGFDLESTQVKSYYAKSSAPIPNDALAASLSKRTSRTSMREAAQTKWPRASIPRSVPNDLTASVPRYMSTESGLYNDVKTAGGGHLIRRVSLNTYMPATTSNDTNSAASLTRTRGGSIKSEHDMKLGVNLSELGAPISLGPPKTPKETSPRTPRIPRDSVVLAKKRAETIVSDRTVGEHPSPDRTFALRSAITRSPHRGSISANPSSAAAYPPLSPRKRHSLHTLQSSISSTVASRDSTAALITPLAYPRTAITPFHNQQQQQQQQKAAVPEEETFDLGKLIMMHSDNTAALVDFVESSAPFQKKQPSIIHEEESSSSRPPSWSFPLVTPEPVTTTTAAPVLDNMPEPVPIRTRSLRGWSASSGTPTASARSSSPSFQLRPQTADTSIDLNYCPPLTTAPSPPPTPKSGSFNIDDYISDDEEINSFKHTAEGEEELLFKDVEGYGPGEGFQLPGLSESIFGGEMAGRILRGVKSTPEFEHVEEDEKGQCGEYYGYNG